jgi:hypothetical protein
MMKNSKISFLTYPLLLQVSISSSDPQRNRSTFEGTVSERTRAALMIVVREYPVDLTERYWRLDKRANKIVHDRMTAALAIIASPLPPPLRP